MAREHRERGFTHAIWGNSHFGYKPKGRGKWLQDASRGIAGRASSAPTRTRTSSGCAARCRSRTRSRALGAERLWELLESDEPYVRALGASTGNQAVQQVKAGLDGHLPERLAGRRRRQPRGPDVSRPEPLPGQQRPRRWCARINQRAAPRRPDRTTPRATTRPTGSPRSSPMREAGFGGALNVFELTKAMIEAGAAGVHFEDQLASEKKCGHMGGKVLLPTLAGDPQPDRGAAGGRRAAACPTVLVARTDAHAADLLTQRRRRARPRVPHRRAHGRGLLPGPKPASSRRSRAAWPTRRTPTCVWCETSEPDLEQARQLRRGDPRRVPRQVAGLQLLALVQLEGASSTTTRSPASSSELGEHGLPFQFITLAGFHTLNLDVRACARLRRAAA